MNKVILSGFVGNDPEIKEKVAKFSLATSEKTQNETKTEWHRIVVFGENRIKFVKEWIKKGTALEIEGKIHYDEYIKDSVKTYFTDIICESISFVPMTKNNSSESKKNANLKPKEEVAEQKEKDVVYQGNLPF